MLGSLTFYRRILLEHVFSNPSLLTMIRATNHQSAKLKDQASDTLPTIGHAIAGVMAGATVSFVASPVEHIKARLQIQYAAEKSQRFYSGPVDCTRRIVRFWP